jgi:hypothetical protein
MWLALRSHIRTVRSPELEDNVALLGLGMDV